MEAMGTSGGEVSAREEKAERGEKCKNKERVKRGSGGGRREVKLKKGEQRGGRGGERETGSKGKRGTRRDTWMGRKRSGMWAT